jgi:serine O-acetyltransferase
MSARLSGPRVANAMLIHSVDRHPPPSSSVQETAHARGLAGRFRRIEGAAARFTEAVRADHALVRQAGIKYGTRPGEPESLAGSLVQKVGLQMMTAYRLMRFFSTAGVPLAPKIVSRLIRHAYGADIHWDAELAPGVMIVHGMGIAVSHAARIGSGVVLSQNVTIGMGRHPETCETGGPVIEKNVFIGPGATLFGPITVGAGSKIMPGCVVVRSVPPDSIVAAATPVVKPRSRSLRAS